MPNNVPSAGEVGGLIPNVWFDIFGRIIPGMYLICGSVEAWRQTPAISQVISYLSASAIGPAIGFLLFLVVAHLVGSLLGLASFWLVDSLIGRHWRVKLKDIPARATEIIDRQYGDAWRAGLSEGAIVRKERDFCSYFVWNRNPSLAVLFGRWDAEALGARSIFVVSLFLIPTYWHYHRWGWPLLILALVAFLSFDGFVYHQRRATLARFDMLLVLSPPESQDGRSAEPEK